jgi:hypothetical protein
MNQISKLLTAACFILAASFLFQASPSVATAQVASHVCGCGSMKCKGCLKGKLFPIKRAAAPVRAKEDCGCAACKDTPVGVEQVTSDILISQEFLPEVSVVPCACGKKKCGCRTSRPRPVRSKKVSCPDCDCDFCELKVSKTKEKKKCFVVKQKEVCVPAVRLPWKKCCPPTKSKVRVVNVLSTKSYECPSCKYEWNVFEPEVPKAAGSDDTSSEATPSSEPTEIKEVEPVPPSAPKMDLPDVEAMDLNSVPRPPVEEN